MTMRVALGHTALVPGEGGKLLLELGVGGLWREDEDGAGGVDEGVQRVGGRRVWLWRVSGRAHAYSEPFERGDEVGCCQVGAVWYLPRQDVLLEMVGRGGIGCPGRWRRRWLYWRRGTTGHSGWCGPGCRGKGALSVGVARIAKDGEGVVVLAILRLRGRCRRRWH